MFWKQIAVGEYERAVVARNGRFHAILTPGRHRMFTWPGVFVEVEKFDTRDLIFRTAWANYLIRERPDLVESHFVLVETTDVQVGMVYGDGELVTVLTPGKRALFWRGVAHITTDIVDVLGDPDSGWEDLTGGLEDFLAHK